MFYLKKIIYIFLDYMKIILTLKFFKFNVKKVIFINLQLFYLLIS